MLTPTAIYVKATLRHRKGEAILRFLAHGPQNLEKQISLLAKHELARATNDIHTTQLS